MQLSDVGLVAAQQLSVATSTVVYLKGSIGIVATPEGAGVLVGTIVNSLPTEDALLGLAINGQVATVTGTNTLAQNAPVIFEGPSANAKAVVGAVEAVKAPTPPKADAAEGDT